MEDFALNVFPELKFALLSSKVYYALNDGSLCHSKTSRVSSSKGKWVNFISLNISPLSSQTRGVRSRNQNIR